MARHFDQPGPRPRHSGTVKRLASPRTHNCTLTFLHAPGPSHSRPCARLRFRTVRRQFPAPRLLPVPIGLQPHQDANKRVGHKRNSDYGTQLASMV